MFILLEVRKLSCDENVAVSDHTVSALEVFPNPTAGITEIRFFSEKNFEGQLGLSDLTGKVVLQQKHFIAVGEQTLSFDMLGLPSGLYFARMSAPDGMAFTFKVIKL
jgi:hypothetical protein